jgi:hypothetical protein
LRRSLVSATRLLFRVLLFRLLHPIFSFHQNNNERIYYYITTSQRRERKREKERERERRETLKNRFSVASSRKNQFNKTKKRSRDWENYTQTQKKRIVFCTQFGANF